MRTKADAWLAVANLFKAQLATELEGSYSEEGITFFAVDPSGVSMVAATIAPTAFTPYTQGTENFRIGLDFVLDSFKPGTEPDISIQDGKFTIRLGRSVRSKRLDTVLETPIRYPRIEFTASCLVTSADLKAITGEKIFSGLGTETEPGVRITIDAEGVTFSGATAVEEFSAGADGASEGAGHTWISPSYLAAIVKSIAKGEIVKIELTDSAPIKLGIDGTDYTASIYIAPQVPVGDDDE